MQRSPSASSDQYSDQESSPSPSPSGQKMKNRPPQVRNGRTLYTSDDPSSPGSPAVSTAKRSSSKADLDDINIIKISMGDLKSSPHHSDSEGDMEIAISRPKQAPQPVLNRNERTRTKTERFSIPSVPSSKQWGRGSTPFPSRRARGNKRTFAKPKQRNSVNLDNTSEWSPESTESSESRSETSEESSPRMRLRGSSSSQYTQKHILRSISDASSSVAGSGKRKTRTDSRKQMPQTTGVVLRSRNLSKSNSPEIAARLPAAMKEKYKRGRPSRKPEENDAMSVTSSELSEVRRNPPRPARPPAGTMTTPPVDCLTFESDGTDFVREPPKKKKTVVGANGRTCTSKANNSFEPTVYFPTVEVSFETVGGYASIKDELHRTLVIPFRQQIQMAASNKLNGTNHSIPINKGALFWGPPGTGKTLMAKALAYECSRDLEKPVPVYTISGSELLTKWVGESESHLREIFYHAGVNCPSIVFIDELDGLVRKRTTTESDNVNFNMVSTLLTLLNGISERGTVLVIATTNFKDVIDPALIRSGRFDLKILFPPPSEAERVLILGAITQKWKPGLPVDVISTIARKTIHYTGADLDLLCKKAQTESLQREPRVDVAGPSQGVDSKVDIVDFLNAWQEVEPSGHASTCTLYEPLTSFTTPLLQNQLKKLVSGIVNYHPIKVCKEYLLGSAAWSTFSNPGLLLDYDSMVFIHTNHDSELLDVLTAALFHVIAQKNLVKCIDFKQERFNALPDLPMMLRDRSAILGLLHIDLACNDCNGKLELAELVELALDNRAKSRAPFIVITSAEPLESYGEQFRRLIGGASVLTADRPEESDIRAFFKDLIVRDTTKVYRDDGKIVVLQNDNSVNTFENLLQQISQGMYKSKILLDQILGHYQELSKVLLKDGKSDEKPQFEHKLKQIIASISEPRAEAKRVRQESVVSRRGSFHGEESPTKSARGGRPSLTFATFDGGRNAL